LKRWQDELHEYPEVEGEMGKLKNPLIHITHRDLTSMLAKTTAWTKIEAGESNPLADLLSNDEEITHYLSAYEIRLLLDASAHVGNAPQRAQTFVAKLRQVLDVHP